MTDPTGLIAYACKDGNAVGIAVPINFVLHGGSSQSDVNRMIGAIENSWSGKFGNFNVKAVVMQVFSSNESVNTVHVIDGYSLNGSFSRVKNNQHGLWFTRPSRPGGLDYPHEAGHLMGLPDFSTGQTVMNNLYTSGKPDKWEIQQAINNAVSSCSCGK
ncbi:hypothetical protein [Rhodanobacter lindaniclasticus]